jgi:WD40 repeat protein
MSSARWHAQATLLPDGRVLVSGGYGVPGVATADVYDPETGHFTPTGNLTTPRMGHTQTLLPDGRVLVVGGTTSAASWAGLASAEIWDPVSGTFTPTGSLSVGRSVHEAVLLADGRVLIVGGQTSAGAAVTSAELYDPSSGVFTRTGSMAVSRRLFGATRLADGKVLVTGGYPWMNSAETYDPATGSWTMTGPMTIGRSEYTGGVLLDNGKVLVAGGSWDATAELYDPATRTFTRTGSMANIHYNYPLVKLADGSVLAIGGDSGGYHATAATDRFDPATGTWSPAGAMVHPRVFHNAVRLRTGQVLVMGGYSGSFVPRPSAELYTPPSSVMTSLRLTDPLVSGCITTTGSVWLAERAPAGGLTVTLHSDNPHVVVPPSVKVSDGTFAKRFQIRTSPVAARETARIEASVPGQSLEAVLTLRPMGPKSLTFAPNPVVGGASAVATVTLQCPAGPGDVLVTMSSSQPEVASPSPGELLVPMGTQVVTFDVLTTPVTRVRYPAITAAAGETHRRRPLTVVPVP